MNKAIDIACDHIAQAFRQERKDCDRIILSMAQNAEMRKAGRTVDVKQDDVLSLINAVNFIIKDDEEMNLKFNTDIHHLKTWQRDTLSYWLSVMDKLPN